MSEETGTVPRICAESCFRAIRLVLYIGMVRLAPRLCHTHRARPHDRSLRYVRVDRLRLGKLVAVAERPLAGGEAGNNAPRR